MAEKEILSDKKPFNVYEIRKEFPILNQKVNGKPLIYFDNAATTQKPLVVINSIHDYYTGYNSNIHRGVHTLAERATNAFEDTRNTVKGFLNAGTKEEIIFTYGTTDGINLVAQTYGRKFVKKGDEIIISGLEHHANIVPWQMLCEEKGAILNKEYQSRDGPSGNMQPMPQETSAIPKSTWPAPLTRIRNG